MIINHQHQFCFFAIPRTASTAISKVLKEQLGSERILKMHNSYSEFMEQASEAEKQYFKFASIRNPMDSVVSAYFKKKTDHNGRFSRGAFKNGNPISEKALEEFAFIKETNASFEDYFQRFHQEPYHRHRHEETIRNMDAIIHFEHLNEDFKKVMDQLNLPFHPVPQVNSTSARDRDFLQFYTPKIIPQAIEVFSEVMGDWGYTFPEEWEV